MALRWLLAISLVVACKGKAGEEPKGGAAGSAAKGSDAPGSAATGKGAPGGLANQPGPSANGATGGSGTSAGGGATPATGSGATGSGGVALSSTIAPTPDGDLQLGPNIALAALGGRVISPVLPPPTSLEHQTYITTVIDGVPIMRGAGNVQSSFGYKARDRNVPHEIVIGFNQDREATIATVVIDTTTRDNLENLTGMPQNVEVSVSTTNPTDGFTSVAKAELPQSARENVLRFAATKAKYVKVTIHSVYKNAAPQIGEIQIYEAAGVTSIVADIEKNLLLPALGGSLVHFTSQRDTGLAYRLIDGLAVDGAGWCSESSIAGGVKHLPQEFTFAFRDHRPAAIDRIEVDPTSGIHGYVGTKRKTTTWATSIEVMVSDDNAWRGFRSLGIHAVNDQPVVVKVGATIRFIKVRILESHGGERTTLGEVRAFESKAARSLIAGRSPILAHSGTAASAGQETSTRKEREPNNSMKEAEPLDALIGGVIQPANDRDVFKVDTRAKQTLTIDLEGQPAIRTSIKIADASGITKYELEPARSAARQTFSVLVDGPSFVHLSQPPAAQVVIFDTSGSMKDRIKDLESALRAYLGGTRPGDRVNLIRFSGKPEVLMDDFSDQPTMLLAALDKKVYADGATAIYDAIKQGIDLLAPHKGNRVILMMTDGEDTMSKTDPAQFWAELQKGGVRLYTIGLGNGLRNFVARAGAPADRVLANAAEMVGGRYLFVADSAQLTALYAQIGEELRAPATYAIGARSSNAQGTLAIRATGDRVALPLRIELVLDASGSMKRKVGGKTMMDIARATLTDVIARLPDKADVALRVYGHRTPEGRPKACEDSQLVVPFGKLDRNRMTSKVAAIKALGTTPIAFTIGEAAKDLAGSKGPAMLILVTDGKEECGGDPQAAVEALRKSGVDVTLNIVGFALTNAADRDYMTKVATSGGGKFFDAKNETALKGAIDQALAVPFVVLDATGAEVARGGVGSDPISVPAGEFTVRIETSGAPVVIQNVKIDESKQKTIELRKDGDEIGVKQ